MQCLEREIIKRTLYLNRICGSTGHHMHHQPCQRYSPHYNIDFRKLVHRNPFPFLGNGLQFFLLNLDKECKDEATCIQQNLMSDLSAPTFLLVAQNLISCRSSLIYFAARFICSVKALKPSSCMIEYSVARQRGTKIRKCIRRFESNSELGLCGFLGLVGHRVLIIEILLLQLLWGRKVACLKWLRLPVLPHLLHRCLSPSS